MVNAARCSGIASHSGSRPSTIINTTSGRTTSGINRSAIDRDDAGCAPKATTNVSRYSASGAIQKSGTGAMSVEKYVVTASIRLDGMNATVIHAARRAQVIGAAATSLPSSVIELGARRTCTRRRQPAATARPAMTTNPP